MVARTGEFVARSRIGWPTLPLPSTRGGRPDLDLVVLGEAAPPSVVALVAPVVGR